MCGIAGEYYFNSNKETFKINDLLEYIDHRGPDERGSFIGDDAALGICRLSIIDLKSGSQPIIDDSGNYVIVFNGEIYNYLDLKQELIKKGCVFKTNSDTEVILNGFIEWGHYILNKLEGMFSIAVYDKSKHELWLARDRFGKKPLYYYYDDEKLFFCSESRALNLACDLNLSISRQSYWDYLTYRYIPSESTVFENLYKLPAGSFIYINKNKALKIEKYWDKKVYGTKKYSDRKEEIKNFEFHFSNAVKKRLISDVPMGVLLSGGIDSSAILYEVSKYTTMDSYHVFFDRKEDYNELRYASDIAKYFNSNFNVIEITDHDFIDMIQNIYDYTDEPLSDLASIPFKAVCDLASKDVKVLLSGEGADEMLGGYGLEYLNRNYQISAVLKKYRLGKVSSNLLKAFSLTDTEFYKFLQMDSQEINLKKPFNITYQIDHEDKNALLKSVCDFENSERILLNEYKKNHHKNYVEQILSVISKDWLIENVLMKSDKVSMSSSVEIRCPFLDHVFAEYLFDLNLAHKIGFKNFKPIGKKILKEYLTNKLPSSFVNRKKLGFPVPAYMLSDKIYLDFVKDVLSMQNTFYENYFDKKKVINIFNKIYKQNDARESNLKHFIWSVVVFELWHKKAMCYS